ncbi:hypothetical protein JCM6882_006412 [Rhodosporidiobolus microsporus]
MSPALSILLALLPPTLSLALIVVTTFSLFFTLLALFSAYQYARAPDTPGWSHLHLCCITDGQGRVVKEGLRPASWYRRPRAGEEESEEDEEDEQGESRRSEGTPKASGSAAGQDVRRRQQR